MFDDWVYLTFAWTCFDPVPALDFPGMHPWELLREVGNWRRTGPVKMTQSEIENEEDTHRMAKLKGRIMMMIMMMMVVVYQCLLMVINGF
jgi:hypothetical protein